MVYKEASLEFLNLCILIERCREQAIAAERWTEKSDSWKWYKWISKKVIGSIELIEDRAECWVLIWINSKDDSPGNHDYDRNLQ